MSAPHGYFHIVGKLYEFLVHLAVVLGGMISLFWLAGESFPLWAAGPTGLGMGDPLGGQPLWFLLVLRSGIQEEKAESRRRQARG